MKNIFFENQKYWINRAKGYSEVNKEELSGIQKNTWTEFLTGEIDKIFPGKVRSDIRVLDVGAGPGFISIILAQAGYKVTALDYADTMIDEARANAKACKDSGVLLNDIEFIQSDAQELPFDKESFDVVLSRNLTWNLPDPKKAYESWLRVLKKHGLMLIFDANWYAYLIDEEKRKGYQKDRENVQNSNLEDYNIGDDFERMEEIALDMPMTKRNRPDWDVQYLKSISAGEVTSLGDVGSILYSEKEKINYSSTPMFMVRVVKGSC